jgi:hypothetical protein
VPLARATLPRLTATAVRGRCAARSFVLEPKHALACGDAYLEQEPALSTLRGRAITAEEYRRMSELVHDHH